MKLTTYILCLFITALMGINNIIGQSIYLTSGTNEYGQLDGGSTTAPVSPAPAVISSTSMAGQKKVIGGIFTPITVTATGTGLSYQWFSNSTNINNDGTALSSANGGQTSSYTPQSTFLGTLYYYCMVTGVVGPPQISAVSGAFVVNPAPTAIITTSLGNQTQVIGGTFTPITVTATGTGLTYQWFSNRSNGNYGGIALSSINGAQTNSYTPQATTEGTLHYYCVVTGVDGLSLRTHISGQFAVMPAPPTIISTSMEGQTQFVGGNFTPITVTATGTRLIYLWKMVSADLNQTISIGSGPSFTPSAYTMGNYYYYCIIVGPGGQTQTARSGLFVVNLNTSWTSVAGQTQIIGGKFVPLIVYPNHNDQYQCRYQWYSNSSNSNKGGTALSSANGAYTNTYTPQTTTVGTQYYYCVVRGTYGSQTTLVSGAFVVSPAPTAISSTSMAGQTQFIDGNFRPISVTATGTGLSYQWFSNTINSNKGGTTLSSANGAQTNSYLPPAAAIGTLYYYCVVTGSVDSQTTSTSGAFVVKPFPPAITGVSMDGQIRIIGGVFNPITVTATGTGLSYQWFSNSSISNNGGSTLFSANGAQTNSYTPQALALGKLYYYCVVTGTGGSQTTAVSGIFVVKPAPPAISSTSMAGQTQVIGGTFTPITVTATGSGLSYQWFFNSSNINNGGAALSSANGAQTNSYTPQATTVGTLYYYCVVTGTGGSQTTSPSGVFIVSPVPTAISSISMAGQTQVIGGIFTPITVTATGTGLSYQWFSNSSNINNGGTGLSSANGGQTNSYTPQAAIVGTQYYYCVVTGTGSSKTTAVSGAFVVSRVRPTIYYTCTTCVTGETQSIGGIFTPITIIVKGGEGTRLNYQWFSNIIGNSYEGSTLISSAKGTQTNSFTPPATIAGTLYYNCMVFSDGLIIGKFYSGAYVVKTAPPAISGVSMAGQTQDIGGTFTPITVTATGTGLSYQWFSNSSNSNYGGTALSSANGAQTNSYTPQTTTVGTLYYYCVVTGVIGTPQTTAVSGAVVVIPTIPLISSFFPSSGAIGSSVTIIGRNFNTILTQNIVFFGATRATVTIATATSLTVTVPLGATYQYLSVTNLAIGLTAYSLTPFVVSLSGNIGFDANINLATGTNPQSVSVGDIDGDGKADLAVANSASNTVSILLNTSIGGFVSFVPKVSFSTGNGPCSVTIGDIDGDGKPDLAIANKLSSTVSVLRNTSIPGIVNFSTKVDFPTGMFPFSVSIGDINGDGKLDLAVANFISNTVSVLPNTSTPGVISFSPKVDFTVGIYPYSVSMGDIDGDGKSDLAVANSKSNTISVLRNTSISGMISFASKVDFATGSNPYSLSIGDLNGDGKADLAVANAGANTVSVLGNISTPGTVSFADKMDYATGTNPYSVSIGDIDGDGIPDLAVANRMDKTVSVLRNNSTTGTLSFAGKVNFGTGANPVSVSIGDLDGDGKPDLAIANQTGNTVSILIQSAFISELSGKVNYDILTKVVAIAEKTDFVISPNPIENSLVRVQFKNQPSGRYSLRLLNNIGQSVFTGVLQHPGGNSMQTINLPSSISRGIYQAELQSANGTVTTHAFIINTKN